MNYSLISKRLKEFANIDKAVILQRFFKTGKGQYGEGDVFLGIQVPVTRSIAKEFKSADLKTIDKLLSSKFHEERLLSLFILLEKYKKADDTLKEEIVHFYLSNAKHINNWDLVDLSAPNILGNYLFDKDKDILYKFADSDNLWEKRISVISTFYFIKKFHFNVTFDIVVKLLNDKNDLIHKANGWMLKEIGKRDFDSEILFVNQFYNEMPRTTLRCAIEKFPKDLRTKYLKGTFRDV